MYINSQYILLLILIVLVNMLKFKQIKNSIITNNDNQSINTLSKYRDNPYEMMTSPMNRKKESNNTYKYYDTDKKNQQGWIVCGGKQFDFRSDCKQNGFAKSIYTDEKASGVVGVGNKQLQFKHTQPKVKYNKNKSRTSQYSNHFQENIFSTLNNKPQNNELSFAKLLDSKRTQNNSRTKTYLQTSRKPQRQNSVSKLKDKLFGMKKIILEKETPQKIYPKNDCLTERKIIVVDDSQKRSIKRYNIGNDYYGQKDLVKISMKEDQITHELQMSPFF